MFMVVKSCLPDPHDTTVDLRTHSSCGVPTLNNAEVGAVVCCTAPKHPTRSSYTCVPDQLFQQENGEDSPCCAINSSRHRPTTFVTGLRSRTVFCHLVADHNFCAKRQQNFLTESYTIDGVGHICCDVPHLLPSFIQEDAGNCFMSVLSCGALSFPAAKRELSISSVTIALLKFGRL